MPSFIKGSLNIPPPQGDFLPFCSCRGCLRTPEFLSHPTLFEFALFQFRQSALDYVLFLANIYQRENGYYWVNILCLHFNGPSVNNVLCTAMNPMIEILDFLAG